MTGRKGLAFGEVASLMFVAIFVVLAAIITFSFITTAQTGVANTTLQWLAVNNISQFLVNIFVQLPLAGTIFGYGVVLGAVAALGVGGYMAYNYYKGKGGR